VRAQFPAERSESAIAADAQSLYAREKAFYTKFFWAFDPFDEATRKEDEAKRAAAAAAKAQAKSCNQASVGVGAQSAIKNINTVYNGYELFQKMTG
jgi:hypothetical protein